MTQAADGDRKLVADLAGERARRGEENVVRLGRRAAANGSQMSGDELEVLFVADEWSSTGEILPRGMVYLRRGRSPRRLGGNDRRRPL
jgi:hypothetical protein